MASDVGRIIKSPADLQQYVEFGNHHPFPIDTAVEWRVHPSYPSFSEPKTQTYTVEVRLITLREGKPYGWTDYHFQAPTLEKASHLIQVLRESNIKWAAWLQGVVPSLETRVIRLTFKEGWCGTRVNGDQSTTSLSMKDVFLMFSGASGAGSQDYQIVDAGDDAVDLRFGDEVSQDALVAQMNGTLAKLQNLFADNLVFKALAANGDERFSVQEEPVLALPNTDDTFEVMGMVDRSGKRTDISRPTYASNDRCPYFDITETEIQGKNRYMGGGASHFRGRDIPWLISRHEQAPDKDLGDNKEEYELDPTKFDLSKTYFNGQPVGDDGDEDAFSDGSALAASPAAAAQAAPAAPAEATAAPAAQAAQAAHTAHEAPAASGGNVLAS